jgi:hypothetical protein
VEVEDIQDPKFDVKAVVNEFVNKGGIILAFGTFLRIGRGTELRPISTMQDMVEVTVESDRVLTFGRGEVSASC